MRKKTKAILELGRTHGVCSIHKQYKGAGPPVQNCWACWVIYLRRQGWKVELTKESLDAALSRDSKTKA